MRPVRSFAPIAAALGLLTSAGCSVVLDFPQCEQDDDCTNEQGILLVCRDQECVEPVAPSTVACSADTECMVEFDEHHVCGRGNVCAALDTDHCEVRIQPAGPPDDIVYIGSVLPRTGTYARLGVTLENAVQLAVEDFNTSASLPGVKKVGWVACDSQGRKNLAAEAAGDLMAAGIEAVVGPALSEEMIDVANVTAGRGAFLVSPTASASVLSQLVDEGLVWRATGNDLTQAAGIADRIASFDPPVERVVALVKNDLYGQSMLEDLAPRLGTILPPNGLGTLLYSELDAFPDTEALLMEYGSRVAATFEREPDVIVVLGSVEARELVLFYLEAWAAADPRPPLPTFILSSEATPVAEAIVQGVSESFRPTLVARLEGVTHQTRDEDSYNPFAVRYGIRFPEQDAGLEAGLAYDATMSMLLAMSGLPEGTFTGADLAAGMARVADPGGTAVVFGDGLGFIGATQQVLDGGGTVSLRGVSGNLEYVLESGDLRRNLTGFDVDASGSTPKLTARRRYELEPAPSLGGTWVDL